MIYDTSNDLDKYKALTRFNNLLESKKTIELKEIKPIRSLSQNSYLHLILSWFALEYGEQLEYIKQEVFKKEVNEYIFKTEFVNKKTGECRESYRSTRELDTKEMTTAIDRFRDYASKAGIYLPDPKDLVNLEYIKKEIENNKEFL